MRVRLNVFQQGDKDYRCGYGEDFEIPDEAGVDPAGWFAQLSQQLWRDILEGRVSDDEVDDDLAMRIRQAGSTPNMSWDELLNQVGSGTLRERGLVWLGTGPATRIFLDVDDPAGKEI